MLTSSRGGGKASLRQREFSRSSAELELRVPTKLFPHRCFQTGASSSKPKILVWGEVLNARAAIGGDGVKIGI